MSFIHAVFFKWRPETSEETVSNIMGALLGLKDEIPEVSRPRQKGGSNAPGAVQARLRSRVHSPTTF